MVKKILKLVTAFTPKKTYEFLPEIWNLIKEYAVPQYVEPIKIGERFINYETEREEGIRYLRQVSLCVRVEDVERSLQQQKEINSKWFAPTPRVAKYITLQTLKPHRRNHSKLVLSRLKDEGQFHLHDLFWIRRSVVGAGRNTMYWDKPDEPHKDNLRSNQPFVKTWDPEIPCQFIKTNVKKLHRKMFTTTGNDNMVGYYGGGTGFHLCGELNLTP